MKREEGHIQDNQQISECLISDDYIKELTNVFG